LIHHLSGRVVELGADRVVVEAGGVGYDVLVSAFTREALPGPGGEVRLLTHLSIRPDTWTLFGFSSSEERALFLLLTGVQGVGPKLALCILSGISPTGLRRAVGQEDAPALTAIPGVGRKIARRLVADLKDKMEPAPEGDAEGAAPAPAEDREAVAALVALGIPRSAARDAVRGMDRDDGTERPVEEVIRQALRRL
jgi:Holliday junction DNA helicase RuvA